MMDDIHEVAPPGWGHTKAEKEKTKPDKPKSKKGGSAEAFKKALDSGRFKGLPGDKTKKEKTASMFKLMWAMKKKGDKPHYKPGTDEKYKKYRKEDTDMYMNEEELDIQKAIKRPGAFTKKAKEHDMGVQQFAAYVKNNPDKFDTRTKRQAAFAKTLKKIANEETKYEPKPLTNFLFNCEEAEDRLDT